MRTSIIVILILVSANCFGQSFMKRIGERLQFGVKGGANYSNYTNADFSTSAITGFHAGAVVTFRFTDKFFAQEEFLFSTQGAKVKSDLGDTNIKTNYLTVPFLLKYRTNLGIYIEAGTQTGILLSEDHGNLPVTHFAKKLDMGLAAGIGFQSQSGFGVGARYVAGLSGVGDFEASGVNTNFHNSLVQASVFYLF